MQTYFVRLCSLEIEYNPITHFIYVFICMQSKIGHHGNVGTIHGTKKDNLELNWDGVIKRSDIIDELDNLLKYNNS